MRTTAVAVAALAVLAAGCSSAVPTAAPEPPTPDPSTASTTSSTPSSSPTSATTPAPTPASSSAHSSSAPRADSTPPAWPGTRPLPRTASGYGEIRPTPRRLRHRAFTLPDTLAALPGTGFASRVEQAPADVIARSTWRPGCPIAADRLAWVRLTFRGFDQRRHTGELLVDTAVARDVVEVFRRLWQARFPIEQMRISTRAELDADPTGDGNDTESFVCRPTVGQTFFSQHAYGRAIDVDPFQNPYVEGTGPDRLVLPELASSYLDRTDVRPGMITPDGPVVRAFAAVGWTWGGTWHSLQDLQHFSRNGR